MDPEEDNVEAGPLNLLCAPLQIGSLLKGRCDQELLRMNEGAIRTHSSVTPSRVDWIRLYREPALLQVRFP
jgi:hypothetical protein